MLLTMVTSEVENICCITFQSSNDLGHEVLVLIIVPIVGVTSGPSTEGLAHTLSIAGFTIKLWDVDFVIDSTFLFAMSPPCRGVGHFGGAAKTSSFPAAVTGLTLRPTFTPLPSTAPLTILLLGSHSLSGGPSSSEV